ncbi:helicase POLQ-like, partial [Etheostoma cragini]|uniref:helicase POLQ-like n=1 Tax=Etheostoma cragini TaxID=417921 RepID=UPI00155F1E49
LIVCLQITPSLARLRDFLCGTLLSVQQDQLCAETSLTETVQRFVRLLEDKRLITVATDSKGGHTLQVTRLGRATYKGSVDLSYSEDLYRDLSRGLEGLLLNSFLHLVYLVTPYDMVAQCKPDWMLFFRQVHSL